MTGEEGAEPVHAARRNPGARSVYVPAHEADTWEAAKRAARAQGTSLSQYILEALRAQEDETDGCV